MTKEAFIKEIAKYVRKYAAEFNIKVHSPIIAQAVLESGYGTSELAKNANNFFGLKYRKNRCPSACGTYVKVGSEQNADGSYTSSEMTWMKFENMEKGVRGYFEFINVSNYKNLKGVTDPEQYLKNIKADGYATSHDYVKNLMNVIKKYNLTQYDDSAFTEDVETHVAETKKYYRVQCGAYSNARNAHELVQKIKAAGHDAIIKEIGGLYKVQCGAFEKKQNATALSEKLLLKGFKNFITYF